MKMIIEDILFGFSTALDAVEGDLLGATSYHSQRVALMSILMAKKLKFSEHERLCLSVAAVLHDNALTEFKQKTILSGTREEDFSVESNLGKHCILGEHNVEILPIYKDIKDAILYHHEKADGTGPFKKLPEDTPLFAKIIHIADRIDVRMDFSSIDEQKFEKLREHVVNHIGEYYDKETAYLFLSTITYDILKSIEGSNVVGALYNEIPSTAKDYSADEIIRLSDMFARIIDFKSPFTTRHSMGIAEKAKMMGQYYKWDEETCNKLYFAGAVHDVGKLFVSNELLEKPGKLTPEEFTQIQNHAAGTYVVLNSIRGIEDICSWASLHHEKLDGEGYPFGKTAEELGTKERLLACLDIYQALVEARPYKEGMSHEKTMSILRDMVSYGKIDGDIVNDIDVVFKDWVEPKAV